MSKWKNNNRNLLKEKAIKEIGGKKCFRCGIDSLHISAYEFHHITLKNKDISSLISDNNWSKIKEELKKCVLLCANCHREVHALNIKFV